jgi:glycosyltransferase involved in cell wall biosynthesis
MKISILIPCYNEEKVIENSYKKVKKALEKIKIHYEIILEEDGSTDKTAEIFKSISKKDKFVKILSFPEKRMGLGWGWKKMFETATGDIAVICDADLTVDPIIIKNLIKEMKNADIVIASRYLSKGKLSIKLPLRRKIPSRVYYLINKLLFRISVRDTQSGFQCFKKEVLKKIHLDSNGFEINLEMIVRAAKMGYKIKEIPAEYLHRYHGHFSVLRHGPKTLLNTLFLRLRL